jgi:hypothetical protein
MQSGCTEDLLIGPSRGPAGRVARMLIISSRWLAMRHAPAAWRAAKSGVDGATTKYLGTFDDEARKSPDRVLRLRQQSVHASVFAQCDRCRIPQL